MDNDCESTGSDEDDYRIVTPKGTKYLSHFLGHISEFTKTEIFKLCKKHFLYKESIYPCINFDGTKRGLVLHKGSITDISHFMNILD